MTDIPSDHPDVSPGTLNVSWLEELLQSPRQRADLLNDRDRVRQILNSVPTRCWLKEQACQNADKRRATKVRQFIVELMQYSSTIWRGGNPPPHSEAYEEALSRTWEWFFQNLCPLYDPELSSFTTWFNNKLKYVIIPLPQPPEPIRDLERIVAPPVNDLTLMIDDLLSLVQGDAGEQLRKSYMRNCLHITCKQLMILILESLRYSPQIAWDQLAQELKVDQDKLIQFYRSTCRSRFRQLLRDAHWL